MPVTDKTCFFSFTNSFLFVKRDFCARGGQIFNRLGNENYSDLEVLYFLLKTISIGNCFIFICKTISIENNVLKLAWRASRADRNCILENSWKFLQKLSLKLFLFGIMAILAKISDQLFLFWAFWE